MTRFTITAKFQDRNQPSIIETADSLVFALDTAVKLRRQFAALQFIRIKDNHTGQTDIYLPVPESQNESGLQLAFSVPKLPSAKNL